jgi:hypothetical protein
MRQGMADELRQSFSSCVGSENTTEHDNEADPAEMLRARRAALQALERELSEFLNNTTH